MCYFLTVGAVADPLRIAALFEEQLDVDLAVAQTTILAAFPRHDVVRSLVRRGCSCDLLELGASARASVPDGAVWLTPACRRVLATATAELGSLRIYLKSRRPWRPGGRRFIMTLGELREWRAVVPVDVLVDLVRAIPGARGLEHGVEVAQHRLDVRPL